MCPIRIPVTAPDGLNFGSTRQPTVATTRAASTGWDGSAPRACRRLRRRLAAGSATRRRTLMRPDVAPGWSFPSCWRNEPLPGLLQQFGHLDGRPVAVERANDLHADR